MDRRIGSLFCSISMVGQWESQSRGNGRGACPDRQASSDHGGAGPNAPVFVVIYTTLSWSTPLGDRILSVALITAPSISVRETKTSNYKQSVTRCKFSNEHHHHSLTRGRTHVANKRSPVLNHFRRVSTGLRAQHLGSGHGLT